MNKSSVEIKVSKNVRLLERKDRGVFYISKVFNEENFLPQKRLMQSANNQRDIFVIYCGATSLFSVI